MTTSGTSLANPAPLGLFGFGMTTILLNLHNAGLYGLSPTILGMGIFVGGIAQIIAGILEFKKGNTFGVTAFTSYGAFWLSLVWIWMSVKLGAAPVDPVSMGFYLSMWGVMTFAMFIGTLKGSTIGKLVFGSLTLLFFLLALANFTGSHFIHTVAGVEGIFCGFFAVYEAAAVIINDKHGRTVLPL
jgi:succinate-acetate transporter protein